MDLTQLPAINWTLVSNFTTSWPSSLAQFGPASAVLDTRTGNGWVHGASNSSNINKVDGVSYAPSSIPATSPPGIRTSGAMAYGNGTVFLYRGGNHNSIFQSLSGYNVSTNVWSTWTQVFANGTACPLQAGWSSCLTNYNGTLYETFGVLYGSNDYAVSTVYAWKVDYNLKQFIKTPLAPIASARAAQSIVMVNQIMVSLGGVPVYAAGPTVFEVW